MENWKKLVNWSELSRLLTGNRTQITSDYLDEPSRNKYRVVINNLKDRINEFLTEVK